MAELIPLDDWVVVEPKKDDGVTEGGLIIPDGSKLEPQEGKVVGVGSGRLRWKGGRVEPEVKEGERVLFVRYSGHDVVIEDRLLKILRESDILAVIE